MTVIDLKSILYYGHSFYNHFEGVANVYRENYLLPSNGFLTHV